MQGCISIRTWLVVLPLLLSGCGHPVATDSPPTEIPPTGTHFDPTTAGTLQGTVTWAGSLPLVKPFSSPPRPLIQPPAGPSFPYPNPNEPRIDPQTRTVADVVVFLRGVDPERGRRWDLPPVCIEQKDARFVVHQGERTGRVGIVQRGTAVEMVSRDHELHSLQARGAAFFTFVFPDPDRPRQRVLPERGLVELNSGAGCFWMRAYLLVEEHPYFAVTNAAGEYTLPQVPEGTYDLVCWHPSWKVARSDLDPNAALVSRVFYEPPLEKSVRISIRRGVVAQHDFTLREEDFPPPTK